jgi:hypothetical protein
MLVKIFQVQLIRPPVLVCRTSDRRVRVSHHGALACVSYVLVSHIVFLVLNKWL